LGFPVRIAARLAILVFCGFAAATPSFSATVAQITTYDRDGYTAFLNGVDEITETFDGLAVGSVPNKLGGMTLSSVGGNGLVITDARNASSGTKSLASPLPGTNGRILYNLAADQKVTFTFAVAVASFAIDINTFLGSPGDSPGGFFATLGVRDPVLGTITQLATNVPLNSIYDPFNTNSKPGLPAVGQFIGFSSNTPFDSITIGQLNTNPNPKLYSLDTVVYVPKKDDPPPPSPVPGPLSLPLLLSAVASLVVIRRRRQA
jgi:hypothetical protein